jgi:hypothetical protein
VELLDIMITLTCSFSARIHVSIAGEIVYEVRGRIVLSTSKITPSMFQFCNIEIGMFSRDVAILSGLDGTRDIL